MEGNEAIAWGAVNSGEYLNDSTKLWTDKDEVWPARRPSKPDTVLDDDELIDAKKLLPDLSFIEKKEQSVVPMGVV